MGSAVRRKSAVAKRDRKTAPLRLIESSRRRSWWHEGCALVYFTAAAILILAISSHGLSLGGGVAFPRNAMGPVGHFIATVLYGVLGWASYVLPLSLFWLGFHHWQLEGKDSFRLSWGRLGGGLAILLSATVVMRALVSSAAGGELGALLFRPIGRGIGTGGAVLVSIAIFTFGLALISDDTIGSLSRRAFWIFVRVLKVIAVDLPLVLFTILVSFAGIASEFVRSLFRRAYGALPTFEPAEVVLPKPTRRRANTTEVVPDVEKSETLAAVKPDKPGETFSHVVVSRRASAAKTPPSKKKKSGEPKDDLEDLQSREFKGFERPALDLLTRGEINTHAEDDDELLQTSRQIESKLRDFSIDGRVTEVHPGPVITLYEFEPAPGVKVGKIASLQDDLAMSLKATSIRIIAPIPKRGTVGIEVPNRHRDIVRLRDVLESEAFVGGDSSLSVAIGKDTYGDPVVVDISLMPHLLIAGATGTGKSVCINTLLVSLLYRATPEELGLILIDPKVLELSVYEGIPHLRVPVVTVAKQAKAVLDWAVKEMERRYRLMQKYGVRNIDSYNRVVSGEGEEGVVPPPSVPLAITKEEVILGVPAASDPVLVPEEQAEAPSPALFTEQLKPLPKIVIVIDELADLMLTVGRDIEELITRLAQKARAAGIHLIVATQRPSVDVITGLIKANFPARLSFRVTSRIDSRTILDSMGAEKLLGRGDMLFMQPGAGHLKRVHGAFVSDSEVKKVIESVKKSCAPQYDQRIMQICEKALQEDEEGGAEGEGANSAEDYDEFYDKAVELVVAKGQASTSMIQRTFRIGYNRAARIIDMMERDGVIGPMDGVKPREVLAPVTNSEEPN